MYQIKQRAPEGWSRAYRVTWEGKEVASFSYFDSAEAYVKEDKMNRRLEHASSKTTETLNAWDF